MIYFVVFVLLIILSFHYDINGKTTNRDQWYLAVLVIFIFVAGLRWRLGTDTVNYLYSFYHKYPTLNDFSFDKYPVGKDPFYVLINSIVKTLGGRFYLVQFIQAAFVNTLIFKYIKKHSNYIFTCALLYYMLPYLGICMEVMRGAMSIVICLYANDYILLEKKWKKGFFLYLIALLFHSQTILLFVLPILFFLRLNKIGVIFLIGAVVVGKLLQDSLGDYLLLLDVEGAIADKAEVYANSDDYSNQKGNLNYFLIFIIPGLIYSILALLYIKKYMPNNNILRFEPMIMLGLVFTMIRMNFEIAYRYIAYYQIYNILIYAEVFNNIVRNIHFSKGLAFFRAVVVFLPFLALSLYPRFKYKYYRYYPYSSVIEKSISKEREKHYNQDPTKIYRHANFDEY